MTSIKTTVYIEKAGLTILFLLIVLLAVSGCILRTGSTTTPGSVKTTKKQVTQEYDKDGKKTSETTTDYGVWAQSPGAKGAVKDFQSGSITIREDGTVILGTSAYTGFEIKEVSKFLLWSGVALIIGGALLWWTIGLAAMGGIIAGLGVCIIGLAFYPWIAGAAAGAVILAGVAYAIYAIRKGHLAAHTATVLMSSIRESGEEAEAAVLKRLKPKALKHKEDIEKQIKKLEEQMNSA